MNKASSKTYISKRVLEKYTREREKQSNLGPIKEEEEEKKQSIIDSEDELSAEEVDSDDLGDDITQKR